MELATLPAFRRVAIHNLGGQIEKDSAWLRLPKEVDTVSERVNHLVAQW